MQTPRKRTGLPHPTSSGWPRDSTRESSLGSPWLGRLTTYRPRRLQLKGVLLLLALATSFLCLCLIDTVRSQTSRAIKYLRGDPPNYYEWYEREKALPQNNMSLPPPQGRKGRYIHFKNHLASERIRSFIHGDVLKATT